jgi:hypothetical protein
MPFFNSQRKSLADIIAVNSADQVTRIRLTFSAHATTSSVFVEEVNVFLETLVLVCQVALLFWRVAAVGVKGGIENCLLMCMRRD